MKQTCKATCVGLLTVVALTACVVLTIFPAYARYSNTVSTAVTYGDADAFFDRTRETLSIDTAEYDFGCLDDSAASPAHTLRLTNVPEGKGILRFSFDEVTRTAKDVAVYIDSAYYTAVQSGSYSVAPVDGVLEIPFSLLFTLSSGVERIAVLDVSWYPAGSDIPTHFARYRMALLAADPVGEEIPTFDAICLADGLLQATINTPAEYYGVRLALGNSIEDAFPANTRYFTDTCPEGITLLRDSALYLPYQEKTTQLLLRLAVKEVAVPTILTVGVSENNSRSLSVGLSTSPALTVSLGNPAAVVSATSPLTLTITEAPTLQDTALTWRLCRRVGDTLLPVTTGDGLNVIADGASGTLTIDASTGTQPAGTYLLVITQTYCGSPVCEMPIWFFIDYR